MTPLVPASSRCTIPGREESPPLLGHGGPSRRSSAQSHSVGGLLPCKDRAEVSVDDDVEEPKDIVP